MTIHKYTIPEFRNKYLDRLINDKSKYEFLSLSQFEGYRSSLDYHLDLCLENSERLSELNSEFTRTRNFLRQESSIFISSFLDLLPSNEREITNQQLSQNEIQYRASHSLKSIGYLILDDEPIYREFSFMTHLNLDLDGIERAVTIVMARKQFFEFLKLEIEKIRNLILNPQTEEIKGTEETEEIFYDNSLVKWNEKIFEFYYLIDALEESGLISFTLNNKTKAIEQIALCFGRKLAKTWEISKSGEYRKERPKTVNGKTNIFRNMDLAFNRLIQTNDEINISKNEKEAMNMQEIRDKRNQEKTY